MAKSLRFREDGSFKIVQFTDPEFSSYEAEEQRMEAMMLGILKDEQPDLVVYTGDIIASAGHPNPVVAFRRACSVPESLNIPWAVFWIQAATLRWNIAEWAIMIGFAVIKLIGTHVSPIDLPEAMAERRCPPSPFFTYRSLNITMYGTSVSATESVMLLSAARLG